MGAAWRPARVRWLEGSRARQTPAALLVEGAWVEVVLVAEELRQGPGAGAERWRRYVLRGGGRGYELEGAEGGDFWRFRPLERAGSD